MFDAVTYAAAVAAAQKSAGGGVYTFEYNFNYGDVLEAYNKGMTLRYRGDITIPADIFPAGYININVELSNPAYYDLSPMGGTGQFVFSAMFDLSNVPGIEKIAIITVDIYDNDSAQSHVTYINPAT